MPATFVNLPYLRAAVLDGNQLQALPDNLNQLTTLKNLNVKNNQLSELPDAIKIMGNLRFLGIGENQFTFDDIEPVISKCPDSDYYAPQDSVGQQQALSVLAGKSLTLSASVGGSANHYQWFKDGAAINGATGETYSIASASPADAGDYLCNVTNDICTGLTLTTRRKIVTVVDQIDEPVIQITSPNGGEQWPAGSSRVITWTSAHTSGQVNIEISYDNGGIWESITDNTKDDGQYAWPVPQQVSSACKICITDTDGTPTDTSDQIFSIYQPQVIDPFISISSPLTGDTLSADDWRPITWHSYQTSGRVKVAYSLDSLRWFNLTCSMPDTGSLPWVVPCTADSTRCYLKISDTEKNLEDVSVFSIRAERQDMQYLTPGHLCLNTDVPYPFRLPLFLEGPHSPQLEAGFEIAFDSLAFEFIEFAANAGPFKWTNLSCGLAPFGNLCVDFKCSQQSSTDSSLVLGWIVFKADSIPLTPGNRYPVVISDFSGDLSACSPDTGYAAFFNTRRGDPDMNCMLDTSDIAYAGDLFFNGHGFFAEHSRNLFGGMDSDMNGDGLVTPKDVKLLSQAFIQGNIPPLEKCNISMGQPAHQITIPDYGISPGDQFECAVQLQSTGCMDAFGVLLKYPADKITFESAAASEFMQGLAQFKYRELLPGMVLIGGYSATDIAFEAGSDVFTLHFNTSATAAGLDSFVIIKTFDDLTAKEMQGSALDFSTTGADRSLTGAQPLTYNLKQNHPNPFNEKTTFTFDIPEPTRVEINIYDVLGRQVQTIVAKEFSPGQYQASWQGTDRAGNVLATGIYLVEMKTINFHSIKKIIMIK